MSCVVPCVCRSELTFRPARRRGRRTLGRKRSLLPIKPFFFLPSSRQVTRAPYLSSPSFFVWGFSSHSAPLPCCRGSKAPSPSPFLPVKNPFFNKCRPPSPSSSPQSPPTHSIPLRLVCGSTQSGGGGREKEGKEEKGSGFWPGEEEKEDLFLSTGHPTTRRQDRTELLKKREIESTGWAKKVCLRNTKGKNIAFMCAGE